MTIIAKSANAVVAEIIMSRQNWSGSFLLLEGSSDSKFWRSRKANDCEIVITGGKPSAVGAIQKLSKKGVCNVVALVDDDHDSILGIQIQRNDLVYTDLSDLEMCMVHTVALNKVLCEYGDERRIKDFENKVGCSLREFFCGQLCKLGGIRLLDRHINAGINLRDLVVHRFVNASTLEIDEQAIEDYAVNKGLATSRDDLQIKLNNLPSCAGKNVCRGHDMVVLLTIAFKEALGSMNPGREKVAAALRAGVEHAEILAWPMTNRIKSWEQETGSVVLQ